MKTDNILRAATLFCGGIAILCVGYLLKASQDELLHNEPPILPIVIMQVYEAGYYSGGIRAARLQSLDTTWVIDSTAFSNHFFKPIK